MAYTRFYEDVIRNLSEFTRSEWVQYKWIEITTFGDRERKFVRGYQRSPDEVEQASKDYALWCKEMRQRN